MRNKAKAFFRNQLSGFTANTIGFVFNPDQCHFQGLDELMLTQSQLSCFFLGKSRGTFFEDFECGGSVLGVVTLAVGDYGFEFFVVGTCLGKFFVDEGFEFLQFLVGITNLFSYLFRNLLIGIAFFFVMVLFF